MNYIYLNLAVTQIDGFLWNGLNVADVLKMEGYPPSDSPCY